jgi:hypothetical protein
MVPSGPHRGPVWRHPAVVIYDNGPLITAPGGGFGGADLSALQTALGMGTFGFTVNQNPFRLADDFTVPAAGWQIDTITVFAYQTGSTTTSTFTSATLRIFNAQPPGGTVIFGDTTTNRLGPTSFSNIYRALDTDPLNNQRPVMANVVTGPGVGGPLSAGTYWAEWGLTGSLASGPFAPPISILGQTTTGNALQFDGANYNALVDVGPQGMPFILDGVVLPVELMEFNVR